MTTDGAALAAAVATVPGVTEAVAVARRRLRRPAASAGPIRRTTSEQPSDAVGRDLPPADLDGGPLVLPPDAPATLQQALRAAAATAPEHGTRFLVAGQPDSWQPYPDLLAEAERVLTGLRAHGLRPGDPALFVFEDNRLYLTAFWACVLGGFVPTPVAVATSYDTPNEVNRKLHGAWRLLGRPVILTDPATEQPLAGVRTLWQQPDVRIVSVAGLLDQPRAGDWFPATADSPVLNLLTSGSTGVPKCVQHTHGSVTARSHAVIAHCGLTSDDISLVWMPLDHVTVAFYNVRDTFARSTHVNARTSHFLGDCLRWLDWIEKYRVTNLWAPNFAFAMVNERAAEIAERSWDLSSLRELTNGGEPVIAATSHRFLQLLAPHGLRPDAMVPAWGMSETCSGVTYGRQSRDDRRAGTVSLDPAHLSGAIRLSDGPDAMTVSTVGRPIPGVRLRVVDEHGEVLPADHIGELLISGSTMMREYFGNPAAQQDAFTADGWFRTGDKALVHDGEVVIAGRSKDQIIVRGVNYLAHELESVVEQLPGLRVTCTAAAGVRDPDSSTEQLAIFFVPDRWDAAALAELAGAIRATLGREVGLAPDLLVPVTEAEFPKTGSGKVQRAALVEALRAGRFADRVIDRPTGDEAGPDSWLARRRWVELPAVEPTTVPRVLLIAEPDVLPWLGIADPVAVLAESELDGSAPHRPVLAAADTVVYVVPSGAGDSAAALLRSTATLATLVGRLGDARLLVLTRGAVAVRPADRLDLGSCGLPGLVRTAVAESSPAVIRLADLPADRAEWSAALAGELADAGTSGVLAIRDGQRWQPKLEPAAEPAGRPALRDGGCYLITGGLGGIAGHVAGYLLAEYGVRLLLVGRSEPDGRRRALLAELAELGDVRYQPLDVADPVALAAAVRAAERDWGRPLDGVLHLAGADPTAAWREPDRHTVARAPLASFADQYRAKVAGTLAVAELLADRPAARLVLFGSVNGEFGGYGFGGYSAANAFQAGFIQHWRQELGRDGSCLAWSMWSATGMSRTLSAAPAAQHGFRSLTPDHGLRLLLTALAVDEPYLLAGVDLTHPALAAEVAADSVETTELVLAYRGEPEPAAVEAVLAGQRPGCPVRLAAVPVIPRRPDGTVDEARLLLEVDRQRGERTEAAPATDLERRIARIWSDALTRPRVGRDQSFFELGGNSLLAARLLALVDQEFGVRIATRDLYERPTVAEMAEALAGQR